jgi:inner membrane protein
MASAITHVLVGGAIGLVAVAKFGPLGEVRDELQRELRSAADTRLKKRLPWWCALLAAAPDLDVLMHAFVRYSHPFGHRGAFHSLAFYALVALVAAGLTPLAERRRAVAFWVFLALASHSLLDMLTNGGLGIGLWWPISDTRFFFPWRPIPVSPMRVSSFFSEWGVRVLATELWFGVPAFVGSWWWTRRRRRRSS